MARLFKNIVAQLSHSGAVTSVNTESLPLDWFGKNLAEQHTDTVSLILRGLETVTANAKKAGNLNIKFLTKDEYT
jgi:hypothetical protein